LTEKPLEDLSFEEAIKKLEITIEKLEKEELTLEETLQNFQEGMKLTQHCKRILGQAEEKVELLLEDGTTVEFSTENDLA